MHSLLSALFTPRYQRSVHFMDALPQVWARFACTARDGIADLGHTSHPHPDSAMAAPAPTAPASAATDSPPAKRQLLAKTKAKWTPLKVTHTWTREGLTVASFTSAASDVEWCGPVFKAGGLRWQLWVGPKMLNKKEEHVFGVYLRLLDRTSVPVEFAETTLRVRGLAVFDLAGSLFFAARSTRSSEGSDAEGDSVVEDDSDAGEDADAGEDDDEEEDEDADEDEDEDEDKSGEATSWGFDITHAQLARKAESMLAGGKMVISITLRSRSFSELAAPVVLTPALPALIAKTLPASGSELADGVDVVFNAAGERVGAHSYILSLRSSTLRASLWGPLAGSGAPSISQPRELDIPEGIDTATFKRVLAFMYTDAVPDLEMPGFLVSSIYALLHAADYLDVPRLRAVCAAELRKRLAPGNAVATLKLAHAMTCTPLLDATLRYIAANAPAVMRAPGWAELSLEPGLMQAVVSTMATGKPPAKVPEPAAGKAKAVSKSKRK